MPITFEQSKDKIAHLVQHFRTNQAQYHTTGYKEAHARQEFIDPLFAVLGWDVSNAQHAAPDYREVVVEPSLDVEGHQKAPDYGFRVGRDLKFYVEAKRPGVDIKADAGPAYQLRRYAWTARLPLSILTDFEELAAYDCRKKPSEKDKSAVARVQLLTYEEYPDRWNEVWDVFSREAVLGGAFDQYAEGAGRRGISPVDVEFLKEIEGWRDLLARNLALRNPRLMVDELNDAVQKTIDRIVFLRMAEDRGMEDYGRLLRLAEGPGAYPGLIRLARQADDKYNSGLFDFARDKLTPRLSLDDKALAAILKSLYFPQSPYAFKVLPPEILGSVYERFLGKVIRLTAGHQARVEEKPEVRKAGGVYYTPGYIVDYIVEQTVAKQIAGKSPAQLRGYRVLDMACGSGSFLVGAYRALLDHYLRWYSENEPERHAKAVYAVASGGYDPHPNPPPFRGRAGWGYRLTTAEKKRILTEHIFGVDIDRQAVEVTKLSLLLQVLEGETDETLGKQLRLLHDRALPDLDRNIQCGNSLIGPDYFSGRLLPDAEELARVNPFDWKAAFPEAMAAGGFDAVIGNPPYIRIQMLKEWAPLEVEAYKELYRSARSGNYDIYVVFVEKGLSLLNKTGHLGFILPNKFFNAKYGENLRSLISDGQHLEHVVHFGDQQVFTGASTYTALLFLSGGPTSNVSWVKVDNIDNWRGKRGAEVQELPSDAFTSSQWGYAIGIGAPIHRRIGTMPHKLGDVAHLFVGVQTSADSVYVLQLVEGGPRTSLVRSRELDATFRIETAILMPLLKGAEIRRYETPQHLNVVLFPYSTNQDPVALLTRRELEAQYPLALHYLEQCRSRLLARSKADARVFWHYPYPKNLALYRCPKLLVQVLSTRGSFAADLKGEFCFLGGGTAGGNAVRLASGTESDYLYLLGILNSKLTTLFVRGGASAFRGGYLAFERGSLASLPIPQLSHDDPADKARHDKMVALVERMLELHKRRQAAGSDHERELLQRQIDSTDGEIDALVYELYGLTEEEIRIVEGTPTLPSP
jgi:hypothetical protein